MWLAWSFVLWQPPWQRDTCVGCRSRIGLFERWCTGTDVHVCYCVASCRCMCTCHCVCVCLSVCLSVCAMVTVALVCLSCFDPQGTWWRLRCGDIASYLGWGAVLIWLVSGWSSLASIWSGYLMWLVSGWSSLVSIWSGCLMWLEGDWF